MLGHMHLDGLSVTTRRSVVTALLAACLLAIRLSAQTQITPADIERLRDDVFEAATDLARLRTGDAVLLKELRAGLDDIRDEVTYLKVTLRKQEPVSPAEYAEVRERIEDVRRRARSEITVTGAGLGPFALAPDPSSVPSDPLDIPARMEIDVRLLGVLNPVTARADDRVEALTVTNVVVKGRVVVPAGSLICGIVTEETSARSTHAAGTLTIRFDYLTVNFRAHPIQATALREIAHVLPAGTVLRVRFD